MSGGDLVGTTVKLRGKTLRGKNRIDRGGLCRPKAYSGQWADRGGICPHLTRRSHGH